MKKLNKFEKYVIEQGLVLWEKEMIENIDMTQEKGKRSIFAKEFPPMVIKEIIGKLDSFTSKR